MTSSSSISIDFSILDFVTRETFAHNSQVLARRFVPKALMKLDCNNFTSITESSKLELDLRLIILKSWEVSNACIQNIALHMSMKIVLQRYFYT